MIYDFFFQIFVYIDFDKFLIYFFENSQQKGYTTVFLACIKAWKRNRIRETDPIWINRYQNSILYSFVILIFSWKRPETSPLLLNIWYARTSALDLEIIFIRTIIWG